MGSSGINAHFEPGIISHQLFSDMTLCISSCRGTLSTLFITSPDWNWSLWLWATGKETDLIRCRGAARVLCCHLKPRGLFIYSSKDSLMWCWRADANIILCLMLWAVRQLCCTNLWSCSGLLRSYPSLLYAHTALLDTCADIAFLCCNVLTELYIPPASLKHPVRVWVKYWHSL